MSMYEIIEKKKQGLELSKEEIFFFIENYTNGVIPDYQASAFTMAVCFQGMTDREMADLTHAMMVSGDVADLSDFGRLSVDKHSTGGVGDKTSLVVAPIVASLGCKLAKMSGRGLGHTGGTVDKLESIPGFQTSMDPLAFRKQVNEIGMAIIGQSGNFAPADKKLYALRDVTATVDSIPLIASSIMSKKLAAGAANIVLDVKCGSGAFMKTEETAKELASKMVSIGKANGRNMAAIITNMDLPLGTNIGNALEVKEAVSVLKGSRASDDLREVCLALASRMVSMCYALPLDEAYAKCLDVLEDGTAYRKFLEWISAQGGDVSVFNDLDQFCPAVYTYEVKAARDGYIAHMNAEEIGKASVHLGAGRATKEDEIDFSAGIVLKVKTGEYVTDGTVLALMYSSVTDDFSAAEAGFTGAITYSEKPVAKMPLIFGTID